MSMLSRASGLVYGRSRRPCPPSTLRLAKALQHPEMHPALTPPPLFGITQPIKRRRREPSLHAKDDEHPQPRAGGIQLRLELGHGRLRRLRPRERSDGPGTVGKELDAQKKAPALAKRRGFRPRAKLHLGHLGEPRKITTGLRSIRTRDDDEQPLFSPVQLMRNNQRRLPLLYHEQQPVAYEAFARGAGKAHFHGDTAATTAGPGSASKRSDRAGWRHSENAKSAWQLTIPMGPIRTQRECHADLRRRRRRPSFTLACWGTSRNGFPVFADCRVVLQSAGNERLERRGTVLEQNT
jgi:hypothetical protein